MRVESNSYENLYSVLGQNYSKGSPRRGKQPDKQCQQLTRHLRFSIENVTSAFGRKRPLMSPNFCRSERPLPGKADIQELAAPVSSARSERNLERLFIHPGTRLHCATVSDRYNNEEG